MQNFRQMPKAEPAHKNYRYLLIDGIRGFAIVNMVLYHFLYDVFEVYGLRPFWSSTMPAHLWQQAICWSFILVSGFVWQWGRKKNVQRGLLLNGWGLVITVVTLIVIPSETIWFGILNFIGCAVLLMIPLEKVLQRVSAIWGLVMSFVLFISCKPLPMGYLGISPVMVPLPSVLYEIKALTPFGFPFDGFWSSDYFPILPWMFLFVCGYFFQRIFQQQESWKQLAKVRIPILSGIGQKTLWIYLLHQPVLMMVCMFIFHSI